jgi:ATPase subunit of ABC transporter with duplicated ATPase domains
MIVTKNLSAHILGEPLFEGVSLIIRPGDRIGIVGPNGSGKTTFLRILAGLLEPDTGSIKVEHERIGYLPQDIEFTETDTIDSFLAKVPVQAKGKALREVGLAKVDTETLVSDLSGGQKRRLAIAQVLGLGPTFLLLDEPTNHLDRETIGWLESFIKNFRGGVVVISHDRAMLDAVSKKILEIDSQTQTINEYAGNYSAYLLAREKKDELQNEAYERQQREKKRLELWLARAREEAAIHADPNKGKTIRAKEKYLQREIIAKEIPRVGAAKKIRGASMEGEVANAKLICRLSSISKSFGDTSLLKDVSFEVRGKERVLLSGNNGSGKTTILKMLMGTLAPDAGAIKIGDAVSVGYFAQEHEFEDKERTVLDEFLTTPELSHAKDPRAILGGFLFSDQDVFKKISSLSLGERVRLIFAKLTNQKYELLVLDEPTNHLDIPSREVIEHALMAYEGAIIAVSHDRFFIDKIGFDRILEIQKGTVHEVQEKGSEIIEELTEWHSE